MMVQNTNVAAMAGLTRLIIMAAGVSGLLAVAFGAFAAHGLQKLGNPLLVEWVKTGASYQLWHAAALLGLIAVSGRIGIGLTRAVFTCFFLGSLIFAMSLYALALLQWMWLGAVTPIGGVLMIIGWGLLIYGGWRQRHDSGNM